jgi:hypothetical protein
MAAVDNSVTFIKLLQEDSESVLPTADVEVRAALLAYGATFAKTNSAKAAAIRRELLAGLIWVHTNVADVAPALVRAPISLHLVLASALNLDHAALLVAASWPVAVSRRILAFMVPGSTPRKRAAVDAAGSDQIQKPGGNGDAAAGSGEGAADQPSIKKPKAARSLIPAPSAKPIDVSSEEASEGLSSEDDAAAGSLGKPAIPSRTTPQSALAKPPKTMPAEYQDDAPTSRRVSKTCALPWLSISDMELGVPSRHWFHLYLATAWNARSRSDYDKMIAKQAQGGSGCISRREDPTNVACVHRLRLAFTGDAGLALTGKLLALIVVAEKPSDFCGQAGKGLGGARARGDLDLLLTAMRRHWNEILEAAELGRGISSVTTNNIIEGILAILERRYTRFGTLFPPGAVREEVLANTARQCAEVRVLFDEFVKDLNHRGGTMPYDSQNEFIANRYLTLLQPALDVLLGADNGVVPGGVSTADIRAAGGVARLAATEAKPLRSALRATGSAATVSFAAQTAAAPPTTPHLPPPAPYGSLSPAYPYGTWPPFLPASAYAGGGPPPIYAPPSPAVLAGTTAHPTNTPPSGGKSSKLSGKARERADRGLPFGSQPLHESVSGKDTAVVKPGACESPQCKCLLGTLHATWDCPLRYIKLFGYCPGFLPDGSRDPAQWRGDNLTRAAKDAWITLIHFEELPMPKTGNRVFNPPDFTRN